MLVLSIFGYTVLGLLTVVTLYSLISVLKDKEGG